MIFSLGSIATAIGFSDSIQLIALLSGFGFGLLTWRNRVLAVSLLVLLLPTYLVRFTFFGIPMTLLEIFILVLFFVWLAQCIFRVYLLVPRPLAPAARGALPQHAGDSVRSSAKPSVLPDVSYGKHAKIIMLFIIVFVLAGIFGLITTPELRAGAGVFKAYIIEPVLFFIVLINTIKTKKDIQGIMIALAISATAIAVITCVQYVTGWAIPDPWHDFPARRATALYGYPNAVGLYIAPIVTLTIGLLVFGKTTLKKNYQSTAVLVIMILLMLGALGAARVEGAFIAVAAGILVMLLLTKWRWVAVGVAVVTTVLLFSIESTRDVLLFQDTSGDVRLALWSGTKNLLSAQPLFGSGLAGFPDTYDVYRLPSHVELLQYAHNIFLDFWVQLGLLGLLWIVSTLSLFFRTAGKLFQSSKEYVGPLIGVMTAVVVYGLVDVPYFKNDLSVLFWTWFGLLFALFLIKKKNA